MDGCQKGQYNKLIVLFLNNNIFAYPAKLLSYPKIGIISTHCFRLFLKVLCNVFFGDGHRVYWKVQVQHTPESNQDRQSVQRVPKVLCSIFNRDINQCPVHIYSQRKNWHNSRSPQQTQSSDSKTMKGTDLILILFFRIETPYCVKIEASHLSWATIIVLSLNRKQNSY